MELTTKQIIEEVTNDLISWTKMKPRKVEDYVLFFCPICTNIDYEKQKPPKCLECGATMVKYDEEAFSRRRQEIVERFRQVLPDLINVLVKTATICSSTLRLNWRVGNGSIEFEANSPTRFTYFVHNNTVRVYFFHFDTEQHKEALEYLVTELRRNFNGMIVIYPPHTNPLLLPQEAKFEGAAYVIRL